MKEKKSKSGLLLCSVITTSAIGISQVSTSTSSALFAELGQKIGEVATAAADKTWKGIKAGANYLWENEKATILSGLFVGSASLFPEATGKVLTGIGKAIKGAAMSAWNLPPGTREIVAMTILIVGSKAYRAWYDWDIKERVKEETEKEKKKKNELINEGIKEVHDFQSIIKDGQNSSNNYNYYNNNNYPPQGYYHNNNNNNTI